MFIDIGQSFLSKSIYGFFMKISALSFMAYAKKLKGIAKTENEAAPA